MFSYFSMEFLNSLRLPPHYSAYRTKSALEEEEEQIRAGSHARSPCKAALRIFQNQSQRNISSPAKLTAVILSVSDGEDAGITDGESLPLLLEQHDLCFAPTHVEDNDWIYGNDETIQIVPCKSFFKKIGETIEKGAEKSKNLSRNILSLLLSSERL
jgi:hypothetical protein